MVATEALKATLVTEDRRILNKAEKYVNTEFKSTLQIVVKLNFKAVFCGLGLLF